MLHWKGGGHKQECQALLQSAAEEAQSDRLANTQPWTTLCATILSNSSVLTWLFYDLKRLCMFNGLQVKNIKKIKSAIITLR